MGVTDDPTDPRLGHGTDVEKGPQNEMYLVLSEAERAKGFVRPLRTSYVHVSGSEACGTETRMIPELCETYARNPKFYGSTYCCGCMKHFPVADFVWAADSKTVGT